MRCELFRTPNAAFASMLAKKKPRVISVGEVHQTKTSTGVRSAISRFTEQMLPALKHKASDLIAETWVSSGDCGEQETAAVEEIEEVTERPVETEDEVVTLLKSVRAMNVLPHILELSCAEYESMLDEHKELDAEKLLTLVTKLLAEKTKFLHAKNESRKSKRIVVIYGGAIHNDLRPDPDYAAFSYGKELVAASEERYLALDLIVPEYIAGDEEWMKKPWYPHFAKHASKKQTLLIKEDESSYVLVFPWSK